MSALFVFEHELNEFMEVTLQDFVIGITHAETIARIKERITECGKRLDGSHKDVGMKITWHTDKVSEAMTIQSKARRAAQIALSEHPAAQYYEMQLMGLEYDKESSKYVGMINISFGNY